MSARMQDPFYSEHDDPKEWECEVLKQYIREEGGLEVREDDVTGEKRDTWQASMYTLAQTGASLPAIRSFNNEKELSDFPNPLDWANEVAPQCAEDYAESIWQAGKGPGTTDSLMMSQLESMEPHERTAASEHFKQMPKNKSKESLTDFAMSEYLMPWERSSAEKAGLMLGVEPGEGAKVGFQACAGGNVGKQTGTICVGIDNDLSGFGYLDRGISTSRGVGGGFSGGVVAAKDFYGESCTTSVSGNIAGANAELGVIQNMAGEVTGGTAMVGGKADAPISVTQSCGTTFPLNPFKNKKK